MPEKTNAPTCDFCGGARFFHYDVPLGDSRFGKIIPCPKCNLAHSARSSGLEASDLTLSLDDIITTNRPGARQMVAAAKKMAQTWTGMLSVHGDYGNGKSTLARALVAMAIRAGVEARYYRLGKLFAYVQGGIESGDRRDTDYDRVNYISQLPLLIIDEVEKARTTEYRYEMYTDLLDARYRAADQRATVVVWNGEMSDVGDLSIQSRLSEYPVIHNNDADMRPLLRELRGA